MPLGPETGAGKRPGLSCLGRTISRRFGWLCALPALVAASMGIAACAAPESATPIPAPASSTPRPRSTSTARPTETPTAVAPNPRSGGLLGAWVDPGSAGTACAAWQQDSVSATLLWVRWGDIDKGNGTYDWTGLDDKVEPLLACGLEVALHVQARQKPDEPSTLPEDMDAYRRFLTELVTHLKGRVRRYAIENEAVLGTLTWAGSPEDYFRLLDEAYATIKAADPEAMVLESGLASGPFGILVARSLYLSGRPQDALALYRAVLADFGPRAPAWLPEMPAGLRAAFELPMARRAIAWLPLLVAHQASYDALPVHYYGPWHDLPQMMQWLKDQGIDKPIEVWEVARHARDPEGFDESEHAQETARLLVTAAGEGSRFTVFIRYLEWPAVQLPGLATAQRPRPAETAFRVVAGHLDGFESVERLDLGGTARGYRFTRPQGPLLVVWTTGGQATVALPLPGPKVKVTDILAQSAEADPARLSVGPSPLFVTP